MERLKTTENNRLLLASLSTKVLLGTTDNFRCYGKRKPNNLKVYVYPVVI